MTIISDPSPAFRHALAADDLLLRETRHRCSNDLQLIASLLALQSRQSTSVETRQALTDAMERVSVLARSRAALDHQVQHSLGAAFRQICEALRAQCEPRSIFLSLELLAQGQALSTSQITVLALVLNELVTNAIKHAFQNRAEGHVLIEVHERDARNLVITVDDDGNPFLDPGDRGAGLGLGLVKRLVASAGGLLVLPPPGLKLFEIRIPVVSQQPFCLG